MSWVEETKLSWTEKLAVKILKSGSVPKHVAFIMDGNRRYAENKLLDKMGGHIQGFRTISNVTQWCLWLGIQELTVYAFSIDNFKRTIQEVDGLMKLAIRKFEGLLSDREKMKEKGICVRVIGDISMLPAKLRALMARAMLVTKDNNKIILNIAFAYTSRDEVTHAVKDVLKGIENAKIGLEDISVELISECLYTNKSPEPDLVVRTSGEVRYSDFMLWQTTWSCAYFTAVLWPEFSFWNLFASIFYYQRNYSALEDIRRMHKPNVVTNDSRVITFVNNLKMERERMIDNNAMGLEDKW